MNVLVTGGAGFIGSHTCKALFQAGHRPVVFDSLRRGHHAAVQWGPLELGDLNSLNRLREVFERHSIDAVLHFAALAYVGESMREPGDYLATNVGGTANLLEAMRIGGCRQLVFSSSCATYGIPERTPITESHPQRPANLYGETKLMGETAINWYRELSGLQAICLRYFNAAGSDPDLETGELHEPETHLIPLAIEAALQPSQPLQVFGCDYPTPDGTALRDYVHVTDLAAAHVAALDRLSRPAAPRALNLGTGRGYSVREVVDAVREVTGRLPATIDAPRRAGDPPELVADPALAASELGWRPRFTELTSMVESAWRWRTCQRRADWRSARSSPLQSNLKL